MAVSLLFLLSPLDTISSKLKFTFRSALITIVQIGEEEQNTADCFARIETVDLDLAKHTAICWDRGGGEKLPQRDCQKRDVRSNIFNTHGRTSRQDNNN